MKQTDSRRIEEFIKSLNEEELRYLNRLIVERLKLISQAKSTKAMAKHNLGDLVEFPDNEGNIVSGRIIRLNKKTVSILTDNNQRWNVAPVFLRRN